MKIEKEKIKELFEQKGYYISDYLLSKTCLGLYYISEGQSVGQEVFSMCLDGPSGAGKTFFVETYCKAASDILKKSVKFINFQLDAETGKSDLYEDIDVVATFEADTSKIRIPGKIIEAFQAVNDGNYVVLKMDEYDKARDVTDTFFNNCLQEGLINTIQHGNIEIKPENRGKLQVFLCKNDIRAELSEPMMRRNRIVRLDYMPPERLFLVLSKFASKNGCSNGLLNLVTLIYEQLYIDRDMYQKLPSCSECEQAIMDAQILMKIGNFTQNDIYTNIVEDMLKMSDDIKTFESRTSASKSENGKKLASLINDMKSEESTKDSQSINSLIAENVFSDQIKELKEKTDQMQKLIDEYKIKFAELEQQKLSQIEETKRKIELENGKLVSSTDIPNIIRNFEDDSIFIKRGFNIFDISSNEWTDIGTVQIPRLSHHVYITKLMEFASELEIKIYENGILISEDGDQKLIVINDLDEKGVSRFRFMSNYPVVPATYLQDILSFIKFGLKTLEYQKKVCNEIVDQAVKTKEQLVQEYGLNESDFLTYSVDALTYSDTPLDFKQEKEHVYCLNALGTIDTLEEFEKLSSIASCTDSSMAFKASKDIMNGKGKVLNYEQ